MDDRRKLRRNRLIERVRTMEKSRAAQASAEAEALSGRLAGIAEKTRLLARHYAGSDGIETADDLRRKVAMRHQLGALSSMNETHLRDAQRRADDAMAVLGAAERKRARSESDRRTLERTLRDRAAS